MNKLSTVCFITPDGYETVKLTETVALLLKSGIKWVQYRDKHTTKKMIYENALEIRKLTAAFSACFIVNDYADIALAVDADGVHLGQEDLPLDEAKKIMGDKIIGISTHTLKQALEAEIGGADYIGFGPVFHTFTKNAGAPKGLTLLKVIKDSVKIPVIAIGGINSSNVTSVFTTGCDGVAASSGLLSGDIAENVRRFLMNPGKCHL